MKKKHKIFLIGLLIVAVFFLSGMLILQRITYHPSVQALQAAASQQMYHVDETPEVVYFEPIKPVSDTAILFYQGALVEEKSYSLWASKLAENGHSVFLIRHPLNLAVLAADKAQKVLDEYDIGSYVIGGHSLGGVMASRFAHAQMENPLKAPVLKGVFFLASYPDEKGSLQNSSLPVLSVTGSNDGVLNQETYQKSKVFLPKKTVYYVIEGGNHAGFGSYGAQKGDSSPDITNNRQQEAVFTTLQNWLDTLPE